MANPHLQAVKAAERTTRELKASYGRLGNAEHPRGKILAAYRTARRAAKDNVNKLGVLNDVISTLLAAIQSATMAELRLAWELGLEQAEKELAAYDIPLIAPSPNYQLALDAILGPAEMQARAAYAASLTGSDEALLLGDDTRVGLLSPAPVTREGSKWLAVMAMLAKQEATQGSLEWAGAQNDFVRQAIASVDERTTDCCLRVHGQTAEIDGEFVLTGTPRYADKMKLPPFHDYCRTATALVLREDIADDLTVQMREAALAELGAREAAQWQIDVVKSELAKLGARPDVRIRKDDTEQIKKLRNKLRMWKVRQRQEIHPAHARSRR